MSLKPSSDKVGITLQKAGNNGGRPLRKELKD
jgi:hypothetical protein